MASTMFRAVVPALNPPTGGNGGIAFLLVSNVSRRFGDRTAS
jgi:hypothetical protein